MAEFCDTICVFTIPSPYIILPEDIMTSFIDHLLAGSKCIQPFLDRCISIANVVLGLEWISFTPLRRRRPEGGPGSYIAAKKPGLSAENVQKRLDWAMKYKDWTIEDWKKVIWSDECEIWIRVNPRRQWIICPPGERLNRKYVKKTFKGAHVRVMVWACFTGDRLGPLVVCDEGGIGANEYEDILYDGLFSLIDNILQPPESDTIQVADETTFLFMQDNARCHKATYVREFLQENHVPVMEWPPQSLDLNPIENL